MEKQIDITFKTILKVVLTGVALFFLWTIRDILILLLLSVILASAMEPMVDFFHERNKIPRAVSVLSVYILLIGLTVLIGYLVVPTLLTQFSQLNSNSSTLTTDLQQKLGANSFFSQIHLADFISKGIQSFGKAISTTSGNFFSRTIGIFSGFIEVITVLVVSFYLVAEKNGMKNFVHTLLPEEIQGRVLSLVIRIQRKMGLWVIGQLIISAAIFLMVYAMLSVLGIKYALVLAILAGFLELIPYLGPIMFAIPGIAIAFIQDPTLAIIVAIMYLLIQKIEAYVLVPKIMQKTVGLSPLMILVAILVGLKLAGILGVLMAVPLVAAAQVIIRDWRHDPLFRTEKHLEQPET